MPKKIKATYQLEDVIKKMFAQHVKEATQAIYDSNPVKYKQKMHASRAAVAKVKSDLSRKERTAALEVLHEWNSGNIVSQDARRL